MELGRNVHDVCWPGVLLFGSGVSEQPATSPGGQICSTSCSCPALESSGKESTLEEEQASADCAAGRATGTNSDPETAWD